MKTIWWLLLISLLVWGAARAQISFRSEQYSETVQYPSVFVPNCPDALYAATGAFVQLEYQNAKSPAPLGLRLESAAYRVKYNAQYALGFALEFELSLVVTPSGVQLRTAYASSSVPADVTTQMLWDYANQVSKRQLEWIVRTVRAGPCRYTAPSPTPSVAATPPTAPPATAPTVPPSPASAPASSSQPAPPTAPILDQRIRLSRAIEPLPPEACDRTFGAIAKPVGISPSRPVASSGCVVVRNIDAEQFLYELHTQMVEAGFTLLSSQNTEGYVVDLISELWSGGEGLVWLRYSSGTNTVLLWQKFAPR